MLEFCRTNLLLHLIIDTSIYRKDPKRDKVGFRALGRLCKGHKVKLYVPEVVKREFISQQKLAIEEEMQRILSAAKSISRKSKSDKLRYFAEKTIETADALVPRVGAKSKKEFKDWIEQCNAEVLVIRPKHGNRVMDDYFDGNPPFTSPKHREDIPDSFIFHNVVDVAGEQNTVYVIANDGALFKAVESIKNVRAFKELDEFISTDECQKALEELTGEIITRNIERAKGIIPKYGDALQDMVDLDVFDVLSYQEINDRRIPGDDGEGMITMVGDVDHVTFDFDSVEYYGGSEIAIPFAATVECLLSFAIYKSDYFTMDGTEAGKISVSELNDHYFDAERDFPLVVKGTLSVEIETEKLEDPDISDSDIETAILKGEHRVEIEEKSIVPSSSG